MGKDTDNTVYYQQGREAYEAGEKMSSLPYSRLSEQGASWLRGWNTARYGHLLSNSNLY